MIELHIYAEPKPGCAEDLERAYREHYVPAIQVQEGFVSTALLKQMTAIGKYQIDISFETEEQRVAWVASQEHIAAWPKIQEILARCSWIGFDVVA